jgi:geranylgeranyl diphosphate synthase type II
VDRGKFELMEKQAQNTSPLDTYRESRAPLIESALREHLPAVPLTSENKFNEALEDALFPADERIRAILTLLGAEVFDARAEDILPAAAALEFVHKSSLIFDELPVSGNGGSRGERMGLQKKYGESAAFQAGLALLNAAYALVFVNSHVYPEHAIQAHNELVKCIGEGGVIGAVEGETFSRDLREINYDPENASDLKAAASLRLALRVGAILAGADYLQLEALSRFAEVFSDAYQIKQGLLRMEKDKEAVGEKPQDLTAELEKGQAAYRLNVLIDEARQILTAHFPVNEPAAILLQLTDELGADPA